MRLPSIELSGDSRTLKWFYKWSFVRIAAHYFVVLRLLSGLYIIYFGLYIIYKV